MKKIQSQSTSKPASISQAAAQAALDGPQECIQPMVTAFKERHDFVVDALNKLKGVRCLPSDGTFYAFPDMREAISGIDGVNNDVEFGEYLLEKTGIALVPGSAFGAEGYMRVSYATSMHALSTAMERLGTLLGTR
jgi:aspartate aminotransferase